ncbi:MAG: metal ABC transporter permease [Alphaproteobacteria bacterium]|nr:metal ABC transporter permease [Alphaproteobacteria bacterium]
MLDYDFMRNAFVAGSIVAIVAGAVGFFLVLRAQAFAGHALSHVGFAGATGAVLIGVDPIWGLLLFTIAAGIGMGLLGARLAGRDVAIGVVLTFSLGLGLLFLHFYTAYATQVTALLFGNVLGVDPDRLWALLGLAVFCIGGLAVIARPLLFATLQPELAEARGVSLRLVSIAFLVIVSIAVAEATQIVGILLIFALMLGPAATAGRLTAHLGRGIALAVALALAETWLGLVLAYETDWPASFWISTLSAALYLAGILWHASRQKSRRPSGRIIAASLAAKPSTLPSHGTVAGGRALE